MSNTILIPANGQPITTVAELNDVLAQAASKTSGAYEIDLGADADIALTSEINAINLQAGVTLDIEGDGATLNGENTTRGLFVYSGVVTIENLTVANAKAVGGNAVNGDGGGGGAGLGGGLFVANDAANHAAPANVTLANVLFRNDSATGGNGAAGGNIVGGGGGLGGLAGGAGGAGGSGVISSGGGIGGSAGQLSGSNGGGFGGHGGFGGGGGGSATYGGGGGFGGGGGSFFGPGGFGGGGGGNGGNGGFGGGRGGDGGIHAGSGGGGGGGLGAGGDIFVMDGAILTIESGSLSGGTVAKGDGGGGAGTLGGAGTDGQADGGGIFLQGNENLSFTPAPGDKVTISDVIADEFGSGGGGVGATGQGKLTLDGAGTLELDAVNTFTGGVTIESGTLAVGTNGTAGSGTISFAGHPATLQLDATPANGSTAPNALSNFVGGDRLDLAGLGFVAGATATLVGSTLVVTSGATTENFSLLDLDTAGPHYVVTSDGGATPGTLVTAVDSLAISGTTSGQITSFGTPVTPFTGVALTDASNGATDTLTITLSSADGTLTDGAGFHGLMFNSGAYTLSGTAGAISSELDALLFTPNAVTLGTYPTTTFTLAATSTSGATTTSDSTTSVINADPADLTISGTTSGQSTTFESPVDPFAGVTITDPNVGAVDQLTITLSGGGGTLADGAGFQGLNASGLESYTLSGTAEAITTELDALVFTPAVGASNPTTTFTLTDTSSAIRSSAVSDSSTSVDNFDETVPTFSGTHSSVAHNAAVDPFAGASISDTNGAGTTDTLTITLSGTGGTLAGAGLSGGVNGVYTLAAATPEVLTGELQGLVFTPNAVAPQSTGTTTFTLSAVSSAGPSASDHTTVVENLNTTNTVLVAGDGNAAITTVAELNDVLVQAASKVSGAYEIDLGPNADIALTTALDAINLHSGVTLDIEGDGATLNGENSTHGLFIYSGTVTIENLTVANAKAVGGNAVNGFGGGGGAGLGGGLFVADDTANDAAPANVTLANVLFRNDAATGGNGAQGFNVVGGGGGLGGLAGSAGAGSGGFTSGGGIGGTAGHGGLGGGIESGPGPNGPGIGGKGGFGGGGGGSATGGGGGGFGGGGGSFGGAGGFGGGGGGGGSDTSNNPTAGGAGGFGGGKGGHAGIYYGSGGGGGGGLGAGGDIFVMAGATLTIESGSLSGGTVTAGDGGNPAPVSGGRPVYGDAGADGEAYGSGIFLQGDENLNFTPALGDKVTISDVIADEFGSGGGATAKGTLTLDGAGTLELDAVNTFGGGIIIKSGTLDIGVDGTAGSGAISFAGHSATLQLDATPANGSTAPNALSNFVGGDHLDLAGLVFAAGATATVVGSTLVVTSGGTTENFSLLDLDTAGASYVVTSDGVIPPGGTAAGTLVTAVDSLAIGGTTSGQITHQTSVTPFTGVTLTDSNNGTTDTLTVTLSSAGGTLTDGAGFHGLTLVNSGVYTLSGTADAISSELDALVFTPGAPGTPPTTTFTLAATSTAGFSTSDSTTSVINVDVTISGTFSGQATAFEAPVAPFAGVTIADPNIGATDTLTITLSGGGGTLADGSGFQGLSDSGIDSYTLVGTAAAITTELDALVFTPTAGTPNTPSTTTFTLSDASSAIVNVNVSDSATSVTDFDQAIPTFSGTHSSVVNDAPVNPFAGVSIADANIAGTTDTLTITLSGTGGTLTGAGLSGGVNGVYTLAAATPDVLTTELQGLVFTPNSGAPDSIGTTVFNVSAVSSAGSFASDHATEVQNFNTTNTVLVATDGQAVITTVAELNDVLALAASKTSGHFEIDLGTNANIALTTALDAIDLHAGVSLDIEGNGATLDGQNSTGGLFVYSGTVTIENLTVANTRAVGGNGVGGGGGGAGLGGGLFVANAATNGATPANVTLNNVNFSNDAAVGGNGAGTGAVDGSAGAGGGLSGSFGGGFGNGGLGGGELADNTGGPGGFGGGGGSFGAVGGFGGGGGGGGAFTIGAGPIHVVQGGSGGFGAGDGGFPTGFGSGGGGGGGLGAGGDIFVMDGATLTITGGSLAGGTAEQGNGGSGGGNGTNGQAFGGGIFLQGDENIQFAPVQGEKVTISDVIADELGSGGGGVGATGQGTLTLDGAGTLALDAVNTFAGGVTIESGTLEIGADGTAGSGAISFAGHAATLRLDATPTNGSTAPNALSNFVGGDQLDLAGLGFAAGATASVVGSTLVVTSGGTTESFSLLDPDTAGAHYVVTSDGGTTPGTLITAVDSLVISGTTSGQITSFETPVTPFTGVTLTDANDGTSDTLTIALSGLGTLSDGAGFHGLTLSPSGVYTLSGTTDSITSELRALVFTPAAGAPGTSTTIGFTLAATSTAGSSTSDSTTSVINADPADLTISGTTSGQTTAFEAPIDPFAGVTIADPNLGATDALTITLSGGGGTLADGAGFQGLNAAGLESYTLVGTADVITAELDALVFTPAAGAPNTHSTTTFTLSDASSAILSSGVSDSATSVNDFDQAVPTFSGTHLSFAHNAPVDPFAGASITDANVAGTTDTLTITLSGTGGTLTGAGLSGGVNGVYTLAAATPDVLTTELQGLVFTPNAVAPQSTGTTVFTLSAVSSAGSSASDHTTVVENLNTTNTVLVAGDGNAAITTVAELNDVLVQAASKVSGAYEIDLGPNADIALTTALDAINLHSGVTLDIEGNGATLDGQNSTRGLFIYSGTVTIENLTVANATAVGGAGGNNGGGGGAGLGGGLFVANNGTPANVTLNNVNFSNDAAVGGNGGSGGSFTEVSGGGGGGLGGNGNNGSPSFGGHTTFGGGGGLGATIVPGLNSGGGGSGGFYTGGSGGGIGGVAGSTYRSGFDNVARVAGTGGFGGGGGAGNEDGDGGFGGGGGAGTIGSNRGSHGGFGGGGGAASADGSASGGAGGGGFGAGNGGNHGSEPGNIGGGGGGLGAGGDIFVMGGATLTIVGGSLGAGTVTEGLGGSAPPNSNPVYPPGATGGDGDAFGGGIFLQGNENLHISAASGTTVAISGVIADEAGSVAGASGVGALTLDGAGTVEFAAVNTFTGGVTINSGTLEIAAGASAGSGEITFAGPSATLQLDGQLAAGTTTAFVDPLAHIDIGGHIDLQGLTFIAGATATVVGSTLTVTSGVTSETFTLADSHQVFEVTGDGQPGAAGTLVTAVDVPTISGTVAGQSVFANSAFTPFSGTTIGDLNVGATDTLTITLSNASAGTLADGAGFAGTPTLLQTSPGIYSLSGTPTALTAELQALTFHAGNGTPGTPETTTFTLTDTSSAGPSISDSTAELAVIAPGNPVSGIGVGSSIDVAGLAYSANTSFSPSGLLTVGNNNFSIPGVAGDALLLSSDGKGGTIITVYATLSDAIDAVNVQTPGNYTIQLTSDSVEAADPSAINLASGVGLIVSGADGSGGSYVLDGGAVAGVGGHRGLLVEAGSVTVEDLLIQNAQAIGGTGGTGTTNKLSYVGGGGGGGGGAGLGGGLFVASGAAVSLIDVGFANDGATGGVGGAGGAAGHNSGGLGAGGSGGTGSGGFDGAHGGNGGTYGLGPQGGAGGGFGGGGGGGAGGVYPFGGPQGGGGGGFGAGSGGGGTAVGTGGSGGAGGGGLGAGGDIFVQDGGTLVVDGGSLVDGTVTGGTGANPGENFGKGLFLQGDATATFTAASGDTTTVAFTITDQNGSVQADVAGDSGNVAIGDVAGTLTGTVDLTGTDTYTGTTTVNAGTLLVDGAIAGSAVEVKSGATLGGHGTTGAVTVDAGGTFAPGDGSPGQITVASLDLASGSTFQAQIGGMTAGSGYGQTVVESGGTISLNGATLDVTDYNGFVPTLGILTIIDNQDPTAAVTGVFDDAQGNALTQGSVITVDGVDFRINYQGGDGNDVTLSDLNVAPTLTATAANPTFTGNVVTGSQAAAVTMFSGADANAVDRGTSIIGLDLTVGGLQDGASETITVDGTTIELGGASSGSTSGHDLDYSVSFANGTATIAFTSSGTSAAVIDGIIDGIAYQDTNTSDPTAGDRTITLTQIQNSGGTGDGGVDTATVSIASTVHVAVIDNQPPTLTATATDPTVTGNVLTGMQAADVTVFSGADASTVESGQSIIGLNLTVGGLQDGANETITIDGTTITLGGASSGSTSGHDLGYSVSLANGTATIAFTSSGTSAAAIDAIIDGISYQDTNILGLTAGDRTITLTQIQDNGGTVDGGVDTTALSIASTVHVGVIINQPPTLTATADNPGFIESAQPDTQVAPVTVFAGANASAVEPGQSIIGLNLTVGGLQDGASETIIVDGTTIDLGAASSGTTSGHDLDYSVSLAGGTATISFSSGGTSAAAIDGIIDGIAYQNTNENDPTAGGRTFTLSQIQDNGGTLDNGVDTTALSIASTVTVVPVNYAPSLTASATNAVLDTIAPLQPIAIPFSGADAGTVKPGETFSGFSFTVGGLLDGANETVTVDGTTIALGSDSNGTTASNGLTYAVALAGGTATVTLSSSGVSAATIDGIIDGLTYADTLANATAGERTITLTQIQESGGAADGGVDTTAVSIAASVDLTDFNNPPTASANPDGLVYVASEIQVNTATAGDQDDPQIAALQNGGYVVTWQDGDPYNGNGAGSLGVGGATGDSSGTAVKAQVFTAGGEQVGSEILVNTTTAGNQSAPAIATLDDGDFVIAWNAGTAVDAQLFTAAGATEGSQFQVNTSLSGGIPSVAALAGGGFAVVWETGEQLEAQTFAADGTEVGSQVSVGSFFPAAFPPQPPAITALSGGGFAVTWVDLNTNIEVQAFSATGTPVGAATVLAADTYVIQPAIAALDNGGFVVTWSDPVSNTTNAQIFSAAGAELGPLIHVDQAQIGSPPAIATLADGDFVIAWASVASNQYYSESYLEAQIFTPEGEAVGSPITVSSAVNSGFGTPDVTALPNGQFAVTYAAPSGGIVSSVYSATGAPIGIDYVGGLGTVAALANNGVATAWTEYSNGNGSGDGSGNGIKAGIFNVDYQETAGTALNLKNDGLSVGDVDGMSGIETLTLSVTEGILNVAAGGSQATVTGSGSGLVTINGTIAEIDALLNTDNTSSISFTDANPNPAQFVTLTLAIDDNGNSGPGGAMTATAAATIAVVVPPVNTVPGSLLLLPEGVATEIAGLSVDDSRAQTMTTTLQVLNGTLTVGAVDGASVSGSGTQEVTVSGTVAQVDAALGAANNVLYQGNFFGADDLTMKSNDNGSSGNAGPQTATSYVSLVVGVPALLDVVASGPGITNGNGDVNANHVVTLTFEMSDVVYVSGGTPTLFLNDGGTATYSGGSGTDALTFTYQVMPGDNTAALAIYGYNFGGASFLDAAGNDAVLGDIFDKLFAVQIDTTAPTVSVAADHTALLAGQTSTVTFTFSEAVSFGLGDATVTGGSLGNLVHVGLNGSNQDIYTATFTPDAISSEAGSVQLAASSYSDLAGNNGAASNTVNFSGDTLAPTVSVAADHTALLAGQTAAVTFTFSEAVASFALGDTAVTGGSLSNLVHVGLNGSDQDIYTATFTPDAANNETGSIQVIASSYADLAGNNGAASNTLNFNGDTLAPTVSVAANHTLLLAGQTSTVTFTFSEAVSNFVLGDTTVTGGALSNLVHVGLNGSSQDIYTATFTPGVTNTEAGSIQVNAASYADLAGNNGAASNTLNLTGDTLAPTVSIAANHTALLAGQTAALTFIFSEAVASFALGDTTVTGGSLSNLVHVGLNGSNQDIYTATFTPDAVNTEAGSVEVNVASYTDLAGNTGASSNTLDFSGDTLAPTATAVASPSSGIEGVGDIVKMTLSFGEAVTIGGATPELTLNDGGHAIYDAAATAALNNPDKLVFDYTVGPTDATVASLAITGITAGTTITDLAGNNASVAASFAGLQVISSVVTANPDSNHVTANQAVSADAAHGVLANDTDTNPTDQLFVSAVDGLAADVNQPIAGSYGTLTLHADGSYTYIANNMSVGVGVDNFVYTMSDGHGQTSTSTLAITVTGANDSYTQVAAGGYAVSGVGNAVLDGSAGNATLTAAATLNAHPILIGGPNDTLNAANFGQDTFVFNNNFGHDIVNNFQPALDVIQLQQSQFGSLANVLADIQQVGADSVLALDANHVITLTNIQHASLTAADFHLV